MPGTRYNTRNKTAEILMLDEIGVDKTHIAKRVGVSRQTVMQVLKHKMKYLKPVPAKT